MDSNCLEVTAGKASVTIPRPAPCPTSSELDRLASQSSLPSPSPSPPTNAKSPPGTRPAPGLAFSSSSAPITNLWTFPKTSTFSSTASKFKPFAKYRTRRLSDDSLTDLSPPTHSDLDRVSPHWHPALDQTEHIEPSSPARSHRSSSIFLGNFKSNSLSQKPLKDNCNSAVNMNLFKSQGSHPSFSSRLRLLSSKHSSEKSKPQPEHSASRTLKPAVLKSFQSKATLSEAEQNNFTDPEEFEAIQSPPCDLRIVANPNYPPRSCSIGDPFGISDSFPELSRSSSSPNLNFPTTFSQRLSGESVRNINPASVSESPKRSHAPPPIKVPKLRASSIAIAVGSDSSPLGASSKPISRHQHSRSETGNHLVRRIAALEWPSYGKKPPTQESLIDISKPPVQEPPVDLTNHNPSQAHWNIDTFDVLPTLNSPRSAVISISNSSKVTKDKAPAMMPLQPAPRRLSGLAHHSNTDSKGPTMPLLISKHSRAIGNGAFAAAQPRPHSIMCSESDTTDFTATQSSAGSIKGSRLSNRVSFISVQPQYPETPKQSSAGFPQNSPWSPIQEVTEKQEPVRAPLSPGSIPFPTSEWPGRSASCDHQPDEPRSQTQAKQEIAFKTKQANRSSGKKESHRAICFDIRNFPLHLDTSQRSESLPHIAIPQPIKIPQFVSGNLPDLPALQHGRNAGAIFGKSTLPLSIATVRPYESSDLSSLMSVASNGSSSEPWRSTNHICTPSSTPPSNRSSGFASKMASLKTSIPATHTACESSSRVLSVDDFYLNINSNALLDLSRRDDKKVSRPRSISDRGPDRLDIPTESFGPSKESIYSQRNSPYLTPLPLPRCSRNPYPRPTQWSTTSIAQKIRESTSEELDKLVNEALKTYHSEAHRFLDGDIKKLTREGRQSEQKAETLHRRYVADLYVREKLLQKHVMTLRALNGEKGARLGESVMEFVLKNQHLTSELLDLMDHTSRVDRMCEAHWRAAATVQMNNLAMKEAQLEAAQSRIEQLESDRARHLKQISDLQAKFESSQDQKRLSSRAMDLDSVGSGLIPSIRMNPKNTQELPRDAIASESPSSTPRISQFSCHHPQQLPHTNLISSRARFNSAHSISSSHSWQSPFENISSETACPLAASLEQASPRTAFLSPYGLAHSQVAPLERAESSSVSPSTRSPRKTHKSSFSNASSNSLTTSAGNFQRSDSLGSRKKAQITGFIPRTVLPSGGSVKPKASMGGVHLKSSRSSSLNSSDLKIEILDSNIHGPQDSKPRSTSNTFLPHLKNGINASSESSTTDGSNEFQSTNAIGRAPSSSSLSRFPRQAAPAPKLPLPYETYSRRHAQWSPVSPSPGNLSSITLSQLGSLDIANLLSNIEYSSQ
ncbi:hypothetical protein MJO28_010846 [Puccinia striiformis f. sp. tritici]|uniref:Uncharacterized protein n=1 Tax=Puccinia striiformis f. sp. tritici TaxID=168172 RepID=A0ACC0E6Z3_9BASI|nr:hypothetical protein MJO28_010846 [Puccinia striiformis f. sp. tritici]